MEYHLQVEIEEQTADLLLATYININALISTWIDFLNIDTTDLSCNTCLSFSFESPECKKTWVYVFFSIPRVTSNSVHGFFLIVNCP